MKKFIALTVLVPLLLCAASCARLGKAELGTFLESDGKSMLDTVYGFDSYLMTYTTVMYSSSAEKYVTFEITTVYDTTSELSFSEITLDGSAYVSFFINGDSVYYDTVLGKEQKTREDIESIKHLRHFTDVRARLDAATLPLSLSADKLSSLKAKVRENEDNDVSHYVFSLGDKYFLYAYENTDGVFETVFEGSGTKPSDLRVDEYEITYSCGSDGKLQLISDYNKFSIKKDGKKLSYEACVIIKEHLAELEFDEDDYSDSSVGEYIKN